MLDKKITWTNPLNNFYYPPQTPKFAMLIWSYIQTFLPCVSINRPSKFLPSTNAHPGLDKVGGLNKHTFCDPCAATPLPLPIFSGDYCKFLVAENIL